MDPKPLSPDLSVSPQITPGDLPALAAMGIRSVICNRPDGEIPPPFQADAIRAEIEAAGLTFVENPVLPGRFTAELLETQAGAMAAASGPVLAYCASGNRSSVVWALAHAGKVPADELIGTAARFGYSLEWLRPTLEQQD